MSGKFWRWFSAIMLVTGGVLIVWGFIARSNSEDGINGLASNIQAQALIFSGAVIVLIGQIMAKAKEDAAAAKEKAAGAKDIEVDQHKNKADEIKKDDEDRKNYVDQFREKLSEMQKEQAQNAKF